MAAPMSVVLLVLLATGTKAAGTTNRDQHKLRWQMAPSSTADNAGIRQISRSTSTQAKAHSLRRAQSHLGNGDPCGTDRLGLTLREPQGDIDFFDGHDPLEDCTWIIDCSENGGFPEITITSLSTETGYDWVDVFDGDDRSWGPCGYNAYEDPGTTPGICSGNIPSGFWTCEGTVCPTCQWPHGCDNYCGFDCSNWQSERLAHLSGSHLDGRTTEIHIDGTPSPIVNSPGPFVASGHIMALNFRADGTEVECVNYADVDQGTGTCDSALASGYTCAGDFAVGMEYEYSCDLSCGYGGCLPDFVGNGQGFIAQYQCTGVEDVLECGTELQFIQDVIPAIQAACCTDPGDIMQPGGDCEQGQLIDCNSGCAEAFLPLYDACSGFLPTYDASIWEIFQSAHQVCLSSGTNSVPCGSGHCQNGGTCETSDGGSDPDQFRCRCAQGFEGFECDVAAGGN